MADKPEYVFQYSNENIQLSETRNAWSSILNTSARMGVVSLETVWQLCLADELPSHHVREENLIRLGRFLEFFIFFTETFNASGGVHQFLFTGKKRMAF